jgi:hypothetical protein
VKLYVFLALFLVAAISIGGIVLNLNGSTTSASPSKSAPAPVRSTPSSTDNFKF